MLRSSSGSKRFCGRFHQGCAKLSPRLRKFRGVSGLPGQIRLGLPKGFVEGSTKVAPSFHQGYASFVVSLVFRGRSVLGCQKVLWKVPHGSTKVAPSFHQGCASFVVSLLLGRSVLGCQKVPWKFHQVCAKVPPRLRKFRVPPRLRQASTKVAQVSWCLWSSGRIRLGLPKGFVEGSTKVAPSFHQGCASFVVSLVFRGRSVLGCQKVLWKVPPRLRQASTKAAQVSSCLWSSGADPSWAAKRFCGRFRQGCAKLPPRLRKFRGVSALPGQIRLGLPKGFVEGSTKVAPSFHQGYASFVVSLVFRGRSVLGCQKVLWKVPPRLRQASTKVTQVSWCLWSSGADPSCAAKRFCGRFHQGCAKLPPRLRKFRGVSGLPGQIRLGLPKGFVEGSTKVAPSFHQGYASFVVSLVFRGTSVLRCQKGFVEGSTKVAQVLWCLWSSALGCNKLGLQPW